MKNKYIDKFVDNDQDLVGHVAYSMFEFEVKQWIEHSKEPPTDEEISTYYAALSSDGSIENYIARAKKALGNFTNDVLEDAKERIEKRSKKEIYDIVQSATSYLRPRSLKTQIAITVLSVILSMLFLMTIYLVLIRMSSGGDLPPIG